ncbi:hypothetical protein BS50DRAFT_651792 [Corynespora cassiicola Philippines]|uniref:C2H2-type domain-containing protein n=1 Tax=Corynespora cassiicola Philippines TaxID=1448308 RepID=A0A2T2N930_CORCC|nr:hypothetical protein BS50DRAFT_651792 [Corynespora cassiicola Philippines]
MQGYIRPTIAPSPPSKNTWVVAQRVSKSRANTFDHQDGSEKPYVCQFCPVASTRKDVIRRHTRNFHNDIVPSTRTAPRSQESASSTPSREPLYESPGRSTRDPSQSCQDLNVVGLDAVPNDYTIELDLFNFGSENYKEPGTDSLITPQPSHITLESLIGEDQMQIAPPTVYPSPAYSSSNASFEESDYMIARANLALYDLNQTLSNFQFPSKHTVHRSVAAFFKHMAPHMPIIHKPTFNIALIASPLLIEIVACGALYLGEPTTATTMHAATQKLMFQITQYESYDKSDTFDLWMLQTYLLMSFFGAYGGDLKIKERSTNVFPYAIKLTQDALKELNTCPAVAYRDWVYQETISRCVACTVEIGASLASTEHCLTVPFLDASFPLPSDMTTWNEEESMWQRHIQQPTSYDILNQMFSGNIPNSTISELGLVCLTSMLLWRVCSFKTLTNTHHLDPYTNFVETIEKAIQALDEMLRYQIREGLPDPMIHSARFQLNTAVYHLYASKILTQMKRLVESPADKAKLSGDDYSPKLQLALFRAAEALQSDCRLGIRYIRRIAPHHFSPICAIACYEGGLLLTWYLMVRPSLQPGLATVAKLDKLIDEALVETEELGKTNQDQRSKLPLLVVADLLSSRAVWQWPYCVSERLIKLIKH